MAQSTMNQYTHLLYGKHTYSMKQQLSQIQFKYSPLGQHVYLLNSMTFLIKVLSLAVTFQAPFYHRSTHSALNHDPTTKYFFISGLPYFFYYYYIAFPGTADFPPQKNKKLVFAFKTKRITAKQDACYASTFSYDFF